MFGVVLLALLGTSCTGSSGTPTSPPPTAAQAGAPARETRDLQPDPEAVAKGWMLFGVTGAPLEAEEEAPFLEDAASERENPLELDFELAEQTLHENDLGDVLKVPFTARFPVPTQQSTSFLELYVVVEDELLGTSRYPSTGYLEETAIGPGPLQPGDFAGVSSAVYVASTLWECMGTQRVIEVEVIAVLWDDPGRLHADGPWDGGAEDGLWSAYRSIRDGGAVEPVEGATRLNFEEASRPFVVGMPFFAGVLDTDDEEHKLHPGSFEHEVEVEMAYWNYPPEPTELELFPSEKADLPLTGFKPAGLWVGGATILVMLPPVRADFRPQHGNDPAHGPGPPGPGVLRHRLVGPGVR